MISNFIPDHVIGNQFGHYHEEIQQGIFLHREIDTFTDTHKIVRKTKTNVVQGAACRLCIDAALSDGFTDRQLSKPASQCPATI